MTREEIEVVVNNAKERPLATLKSLSQEHAAAEYALIVVYKDNQQLARDIWNLRQDREHLLTRITALEKKLNKRP